MFIPCPNCQMLNVGAGITHCKQCGQPLDGESGSQDSGATRYVSIGDAAISSGGTDQANRPLGSTEGRKTATHDDKQSAHSALLENPHLRAWLQQVDAGSDGTLRFRPEQALPLYSLVIFGSAGLPVEIQLLQRRETSFGRDEGHVRLFNDPMASSRHAVLSYNDEMNLVLSDVGSTNGTFFKLRPKLGFKLWDGCQILCGRQLFTFVASKKRRASGAAAPSKTSRKATMAYAIPQTDEGHGQLRLENSGKSVSPLFELGERTIVGRSNNDCDICINDDCLSPSHALFEYNVKIGQVVVADHNSANGVFVQIRNDVPLEDGDVFRIGEQLFGVVLA